MLKQTNKQTSEHPPTKNKNKKQQQHNNHNQPEALQISRPYGRIITSELLASS